MLYILYTSYISFNEKRLACFFLPSASGVSISRETHVRRIRSLRKFFRYSEPAEMFPPAIGHSQWISLAAYEITETEILAETKRQSCYSESFGRFTHGGKSTMTTTTTTTVREIKESVTAKIRRRNSTRGDSTVTLLRNSDERADVQMSFWTLIIKQQQTPRVGGASVLKRCQIG